MSACMYVMYVNVYECMYTSRRKVKNGKRAQKGGCLFFRESSVDWRMVCWMNGLVDWWMDKGNSRIDRWFGGYGLRR